MNCLTVFVVNSDSSTVEISEIKVAQKTIIS